MGTVVRPFIFAWHFLTAVPLSRRHHDPTAIELASSMAWYSTIGLIIGGILVVADVLLAKVFAVEVVNTLLIVVLVGVTRGLHQDGLADTLDGLAGGRTPETRLSIMRDPRIGAIGATGLFLSLLLRYAALVALPSPFRIPALVCMPAVGRCAMVTLAWLSPYARAEGGLATPFLAHLSMLHVLAASLVLAVALSLGFGIVAASIILCVCLAVILVVHSGCRWLFGGITGDILGATNEAVEILFVLFVPLLLAFL